MSRHSSYGIVAAFLFGGCYARVYARVQEQRYACIINEYIHHPLYREVLRLRFCDSYTYEEISGAVSFSPQHVKAICAKYKPVLISHL